MRSYFCNGYYYVLYYQFIMTEPDDDGNDF